MEIISVQSGSNGNCYYVETPQTRLLLDAGISGRKATERLREFGRNTADVDFVLVSHDHSDHTKGAGVFCRQFAAQLVITEQTFQRARKKLGKVKSPLFFSAGSTFHLRDLTVTAISTPHDGVDPCVFVLEHEGKRVGIFTDLGHPFEELAATIETLDAVMLESNYDPWMLQASEYSYPLQERISGQGGHLSNEDAAKLLREHATERLQWACLCHLSENCNTPELAERTHRTHLPDDFPFRLVLASRSGAVSMPKL